MSDVKVLTDKLVSSLSDDQLRYMHEMNRRRAEGLADNGEMREFGSSVGGIIKSLWGENTAGGLSIDQLREIARALLEKMSAELERRERERGRPN